VAASFLWDTAKSCHNHIKRTGPNDDIDFVAYIFSGSTEQCAEWHDTLDTAADELFLRIKNREEV
jgi:hypothetical protein